MVGKNIDMKTQFIQSITNVTISCCTVAISFGNQSVLLEMDEGLITEEVKEAGEYSRVVKNLNDLIYLFKRMLKQHYNLTGYITITEDQGAWETKNAYLPVQLMASDFVTVFQDEDGN